MRIWLGVWLCLGLGVHEAQAYLGGPEPDSYLIVSLDKSRGLVMCPPSKSKDDAGRFALLPDGQKLDLYRFSSNGVYRLSDLRPLYFLNWFEQSNTLLSSPDLESVVRVCDWAVDTYPWTAGRPMPKALEFYHSGNLIHSYVASELVENPGKDGFFHTIPWPEHGYNTAWMANCRVMGSNELEVVTASRGIYVGRYGIKCSSGNRYMFNLVTGQIVSEEHPMRTRARVVGALLLCLALGAAGWLLRRKPQLS